MIGNCNVCVHIVQFWGVIFFFNAQLIKTLYGLWSHYMVALHRPVSE